MGGCQAAWAGYGPLGSELAAAIAADVASLRGIGGDVVISFGGSAGTELARACSSVDALRAQYQSVIDAYRPAMLDFDVEGAAERDQAANDRRAKAIAAIQAADPSVRVSLTLEVSVYGLDDVGLAVLQNAIANGVRLSRVNIMTMYFGGDAEPQQMADNAFAAAANTLPQLAQFFPWLDGTALRQMLSVTPLIGHNDDSGEVFSLDDAVRLRDWAATNGIGAYSMWSLDRDQGCDAPGAERDLTCSGLAQPMLAFTDALRPR
jgi:hypothetical protein